MTIYYHNPLTGINNVDAITFNTISSDLDAAIYANSQAISNALTAEAGEGVADRDAGYISLADGKAYLLDADSAPADTSIIRGFFDGTTIIAGTATLQISGIMDGFTGLTVLQPVYVDTTSGAITQTRPIPTSGGSQIAIIEMGFAVSSTQIFISPKPIQYQMRDAMVQNDTLTVQHHNDPNGYKRKISAYISETVAGAVIEEYTSSNQDSQLSLEQSGYTADLCSGGTAIGDMTNLANAFDDVNSTDTSKAGIAGIVGYDFGASNDKTIIKYTVAHPSGTSTLVAAKDWTFQYSDNNSTWTTAHTVTGEVSWGDGEVRTFTFTSAGAHRYWRLNVTDSNGAANLRIGEVEMMEVAASNQKLSQSFTLGSAQDIASVQLYLRKVGSPTGTLTVRIETDSAGDPTGTLAHANATTTLAESSLTTSFADTLISFASQFNLTSGTYHIVISTSRATSSTNYIEWGADASTPAYSGGEGKSYDGATWSAESVDFIFGVYEPGTIHPSRVSVDWWSSSYADMVNRYGDGAGASLETQTTFKCTRVSGFDDITVIVEIE